MGEPVGEDASVVITVGFERNGQVMRQFTFCLPSGFGWSKVTMGPPGFNQLPIWFGTHEKLTKEDYKEVGITLPPTREDLPAVFSIKDGHCLSRCWRH